MNRLIIVAAVVIIVAIGGFFLVSGNKSSQISDVQPSLAVSPEESASPTSSETSDKKTSETQIELNEDGFNPAKVTIKVGDKVIWKNNSGGAATVSSDPHPAHTLYPILNLGPFNDGDTHSVAFDKAGTYTYHNHLDASQKGTVVVE